MIPEQRLIQHQVRSRLDKFVQVAFPSAHPNPEERFEPEWFIEPLCYAVQSATEAEACRLLVTMPPRHLKSFSAGICLSAFSLGHNPALKIAIAVYGEELAREHMKTFKAITQQRWFQATFPEFRLAKGGDGVDSVVTTRNGGLRFVSIGGAFTGVGINVLIIDDVIKAQEVGSAVKRDAVLRFFRQTCLTRFNDPRKSRIIVVAQRLHTQDIPAMLIEQGGFSHLNLPSIADRDTVLATYGGREVEWRAGQLLSPRRFPREELDRLQREMGAHAFSAQFLQTPLVADGMIVDLSRLHLVDAPPVLADLRYVVLSIDTAVKVGDACDYSVIGVWGYDGLGWCLMHVLQQRLDFVELKAATIMTAQVWKADVVVIEDCHTGVALWAEVRHRVNSAVVLPPRGDKAERLAVAVDRLYSGEIRFPRREPWSDAVFLELRSFPDGHDDIVDMITQFVAWRRTKSMRSLLEFKHHGRPSNPARRAASG